MISEINHHLVTKLLHLSQHVRYHGSHHDDGHPQPVHHVEAGDGPWFVPLTPVEQVRVDVGEPEAGHVKTHDDILSVADFRDTEVQTDILLFNIHTYH